MLLIFNKDLEITNILKKTSEEGKKYLDKFPCEKPFLQDMLFCPIILRFEMENDCFEEDNGIQIKKGKDFALEFDLPDKNEEFYYEDCLLLAKEVFLSTKFPVKKNFIYETILDYSLVKSIH